MPTRRLLLSLSLGAFLAAPAWAQEALKIEQPWARATATSAKNGAAYVRLVNGGPAVDRLLAASSPVAARAELHTHLNEDGVMKMRQVAAVELPPGATVAFGPSGLHIMLFGLTGPLKQGTTFPLTLTFEKAGSRTVTVTVEGAGARGPSQGG
ncbi:MAG: copper chaperone PCu(A)C [Alphaproteobacteria bacterium]|nr:copper chaperone PCu(A)C [Alphaproteobacteria bacterium]